MSQIITKGFLSARILIKGFFGKTVTGVTETIYASGVRTLSISDSGSRILQITASGTRTTILNHSGTKE